MERHHPSPESERTEVNDPIAKVLKLAGSRPQPDPARTTAFKNALHTEWRRVTQPRSQRRTVGWAAAIASGVAAAVVFAWLQLPQTRQPPGETPVVGRVVRTEGIVRRLTATATSTPPPSVSVGDALRAHTVLETTGTARMAIALDEGMSLRVDVGSRIVMVGPRIVKVERGGVYVDSAATSGSVLIQTPHGEVRDVGTQFEVRADGSSFRVRVREGEVVLSRGGSETTARAGEALHVDAQGGLVRGTVSIFGPEWAWTRQIAPRFQLEGSTVRQFLDWVAREQGWRWRFADEKTARQAAGIVTHGSVDGYTPEEALSIVLPTCGLSFVRNGDDVVVSLVKESSPRDK